MDRQTVTSTRINSMQLTDQYSYLEIGVAEGETFLAVRAAEKVGVDPAPSQAMKADPRIQICTSDDFFREVATKFDVIFIDGLHTIDQVARDFHNALRLIKKHGVIIIDDVYPDSRSSSCRSIFRYRVVRLLELIRNPRRPPVGWQGDVYKIMSVLRRLEHEVQYSTVVDSGRKLQTFIFGSSIESQKFESGEFEGFLLDSREFKRPTVYGRQPRDVAEVSEVFNPVTWDELLSLMLSSRSSK